MNDNPFTCPICGNEKCVPPSGYMKSQILIIAEFPNRDEIIKGKPLVGRTGDILRAEFALLGVDISRFRVANLWQHIPNANEDCLKRGIQVIAKEAKGKKAILLLGSDVVHTLCNESVSKVCGLKVHSPYLSAPTIVACVNPAQAFNHPIGELRLALKKFTKYIEEIL